MGQTALLPFEGRRAEDFFALKNPVGFEPANLVTKDQHATSRPPKPLNYMVTCTFIEMLLRILLIFAFEFARTVKGNAVCEHAIKA